MAVSYIGASNLIATNGGNPTAITAHANTQTGDLLLAFHYSRATGGNETVAAPAGNNWNTLFNSVTANNGLVAVFWKIREVGDTTYTFTVTNHTSGTSGETILEWIETYRGHNPAVPISNYTAALSTWASSLDVGSISAPATATVNDGDMVVVFGGRFENITAQTTLTGDSLTWAQNTLNNTNLGSDAGAITQSGLNSSGSDQTVTAKTITTTGTAQAGAGRMLIIEFQKTYTLSSSKGTFTHTGKAMNPEYGRLLSSSKGTFTQTGKDATLTVGTTTNHYTMPSSKGTFSETGKNVTFLYNRVFTASKGVITHTGNDASLTKQYLLSSNKATFTETGKDASLLKGYALLLSKGAFSVTGKNIDFPRTYVLSSSKGIISETGKNSSLLSAFLLSSQKGVFTETGKDATLSKGYAFVLQKGSFLMTGKDSSLTKQLLLSHQKGVFTHTGKDATLTYTPLGSYTLPSSKGTFVMTGKDASLVYSPILVSFAKHRNLYFKA